MRRIASILARHLPLNRIAIIGYAAGLIIGIVLGVQTGAHAAGPRGVLEPATVPAATATPAFYAHRGGNAGGPDNSLNAMKASWSAGYSIEMDVRLSSELAPWLAHDDALSALGCGGSGYVHSTHSRQLNLMSCNGQPLATLAEVLRYVSQTPGAAGQRIAIETKTAGTSEIEAILRTVQRYGLTDRVIIESFWWGGLAYVEAVAPEVTTMALWNTADMTDDALAEPVDILAPYYALATDAVIADPRPVVVWTVNDKATADSLTARGVDGIISDTPEALS